MAIRFSCPRCENQLLCQEDEAGLKGKCPVCRFRLVVPARSDPTAGDAGPNAGAAGPDFVRYGDALAVMADAAQGRRPKHAFPLVVGSDGQVKAVLPKRTSANLTVLAGIGMAVGAVVWFVVGWMVGYIFFYPPILLLLGLGTIWKGLTGRDRTHGWDRD